MINIFIQYLILRKIVLVTLLSNPCISTLFFTYLKNALLQKKKTEIILINAPFFEQDIMQCKITNHAIRILRIFFLESHHDAL